jgi:NTE family protein
LFPAVRIGDAWYGDESMRLPDWLAPAMHPGTDCMLGISNRYRRSRFEADQPPVQDCPPAAQLVGIHMTSVIIGALSQEAITLERVNRLVDELPPQKRDGMRPVDFLQLRPSVDLGRLAREYESEIPSAFRFLTTGLRTQKIERPDWLVERASL